MGHTIKNAKLVSTGYSHEEINDDDDEKLFTLMNKYPEETDKIISLIIEEFEEFCKEAFEEQMAEDLETYVDELIMDLNYHGCWIEDSYEDENGNSIQYTEEEMNALYNSEEESLRRDGPEDFAERYFGERSKEGRIHDRTKEEFEKGNFNWFLIEYLTAWDEDEIKDISNYRWENK